MKNQPWLLTLAALSMSSTLMAAPPGGQPPRGAALDTANLFVELDQDGDQQITSIELSHAGISEGFSRMADKNSDGVISAAELGDARFPPPADEDGDGVLTLAELTAFEANRPQGGPGGKGDGRPMGEPPER